MSRLEEALELTKLGWPVFPVELVLEGDKVRKRPHRMLGAEGGHRHGTLNREQIRGWWSRDPEAGIGSAASLAADVDTDPARSTARRLGLRAGAVVVTPNGHHVHFAPARPQRASVLSGPPRSQSRWRSRLLPWLRQFQS